ncbi:MAG: hypothetical protein ACE37F_14235 [Nannocystaceae bacterium]|nr:hypothetical protein [bacterium]
MTSETDMIGHRRGRGQATSLDVLEDRVRRMASDFERLLKMQEARDRADVERARVEATITTQLKSIQDTLDELKKEDIGTRLAVLEGKRQSDDRRRREAETGPHAHLTALETQQRVEESKSRSKLWAALAAAVAAAGGAITTWLATR